MKTTLSEREGNTVKLQVEVSSEELQEAFDKRLKQLTREARIPGFRPGKVPATVLRRRFGDEAVMAEAIEDAMNAWLAGAAREVGVEPVERPDVDAGDEAPEIGKPLSFTATMTVMPEVVLGDYKGLEVAKDPTDVGEEEIDAQIERLRNEFGELRPVEERPVQQGDFVTADFSATFEGQPVEALGSTDFVFEVGVGNVFPEIDTNVIGMRPDEERTFKLALSESHAVGEATGKEVDFTVKVKEAKEKILPQVTDEWASEVSEFSTVDELRREIREKLQNARNFSCEELFRSRVVRKVVENAAIELPESVVRTEAQAMAGDFARSLVTQGMDFPTYLKMNGITAEQVVRDMAPQAARYVKTGMVLDAVVKAEGLELTDDDLKVAIAEMASAAGTEPQEVEERLDRTGSVEQFRQQVLREKAAAFLTDSAIAIAPPVMPGPVDESATEQAAESTAEQAG